MVGAGGGGDNSSHGVSVLALSSRFDGPLVSFLREKKPVSFSTRSVESF